MATKKIQVSDSEGNVYHFESDSELILITSDKIIGTNVKEALELLNEKKVNKGSTWDEFEGN